MLFSLLPLGISASSAPGGKHFVVYFPNWGMYNSARKSMQVGMIPWDNVTCINHSFFTIDSNFKLVTTDEWADFQYPFAHADGWDKEERLAGHFAEYRYYKSQYPNVKLMVSVGGWTRGENFHAMALTASSRAIFIQSVIDFLKKYPFIDGIDLDWLNIMTYDIHGAWENVTNHHALIYANPNDPSPISPIDVKNKYNTDFIMSKAPVGNIDDPQNPGGQNSYGQMKTLESTTGYVKYRDPYALVSWLYNQSLGIMYTYEDEVSAEARCDYVINNGFGGIIAWDISVDADDFPLASIISQKLGINSGIQTVAAPSFNPAGGTYSSAQSVSISCDTAGATIRYTTDGSEPTASSAQYTAPITVSAMATIKAKAFKAGMNDSTVAIASFIISAIPSDLPSKLLVGYWHNFNNGSTVIRLKDVSAKWDVINVAFADITGDGTVSFTPFNSTEAEFKSDIAYLNSIGKKVVLSLGGQDGALSLPDSASKVRFTNSLIATIEKYGFNGVDIDIETGISLAGGDSDFKNPTTPTIVNLIAATNDVCARFGSKFILSMAPEIAYVHGGITAYAGPWGAYLPIIYGLMDKLTYIQLKEYIIAEHILSKILQVIQGSEGS